MSEPRRCSACGTELTESNSAQGLCPACLLRLGLSDPSIAPAPEPKTAESSPQPTQNRRPGRRYAFRGTFAGLLLFAVLAAAGYFYALRPGDVKQTPVIHFTVYPTSTDRFGPSTQLGDFAVSPDGRQLVYVSPGENGTPVLWIHPLDALADRLLDGTEDASLPFWSPDSRSVGFFAHSKLRRIDVFHGGLYTLCEAPEGRGGTWSRDGGIVFSSRALLYRVSANGGDPQVVTTLDNSRHEIAHRWPFFLPDGRHLLFTALGATREGDGIYVAALDSKTRTRVLSDRSAAAYVEEGRRGKLLFVRGRTLMTQPFDPSREGLSGEPTPVRFAENIEQNKHARGAFSLSLTGILAYRTHESRPSQLLWIDRAGKMLGRIAEPGEFHSFSLSPDGRFAAVSRLDHEAAADIWLLDLAREIQSRFTFDPAMDADPLWSPDGSLVVFLSNRNGLPAIYQKSVRNGTSEELLLRATGIATLDSWSPDGRYILYTRRSERGKTEIAVVATGGDHKPFSPVQSEFDLKQAHFSPDGRWIAYVSNESGKDEVFVQTFPELKGKWQVSASGGFEPRWSPDGRELFYISADGMLMAVAVSGNSGVLESGIPRSLLHMTGQEYQVSRDGRFLVMSQPEGSTPAPIHVVVGWDHER